ncbi:MAG TPA: putative baseplate assembly protein [Mycobacteriales bacterium]|nr:putative baseplate assembly protein [Mycobacteriales bacterium]
MTAPQPPGTAGAAPQLDARPLPALLGQLGADARGSLPGWTPPADGDAGTALYRIFARFVELGLARLNGVPDKTRLSFLDTMGIDPLPATPARAPLVFGLAAGAGPTLVPAGTQVGVPAGGGRPEVLFETERDLLALPAKLVAARTVDPVWDRGSDLAELLAAPAPGTAAAPGPPAHRLAFVGDTPLPHVLHVGDEAIFSGPRETNCILAVSYRSSAPDDQVRAFLEALQLSCDTGGGPRVLPLTIGFSHQLVYLEATVPAIDAGTLAGVGLAAPVTGGWLRLRLPAPLPDAGVPADLLLTPQHLDVLGTDLLPDAVLAGTTPVDPTADFLPFGPSPKAGDTLLIRADQALARALTVSVTVRVAAGTPTANLVLAWEYLGADGWTAVTDTEPIPAVRGREAAGPAASPASQQPTAVDPTPVDQPTPTGPGTLTASGTVQLTLPPVPVGQVGSQRGRWLRVRIAAGGYGRPVEYEPVNPADLTKGYRVRAGTGTVDPPRLRSLRLSYLARVQPRCVVQVGDCYQLAGPEFAPYPAPAELPAPYADPGPALYLGFDGLRPQQPVSLYCAVPVAELTRPPLPAPDLPAPALPAGAGPVAGGLRWEYYDGAAWRELTVFDGTAGLTLSGLVSLITPADIAELARFEPVPRTWLRVRAGGNDPLGSPRLTALQLNAAPAVASVGVTGEVLGSSVGQPGQTFRTSRRPVQPGQELLVAEPQGLPADEEQALIAEEGPAVTRPDPAGADQIWVRWHEVPNLVRSGPDSRHYTVDRDTGTVGFGDGRRGLIPPPGTANLVLSYRAGGGAGGNVPPASAVQLRTPVPGVISVSNPVAADGGADAEPLAAVRERGARVLRHRGRAVATADVEWLARQAAGTRVARAVCLPNLDRRLAAAPGWLTVLVVPDGTAPTPRPAPELVRTVADYLAARGPVSLAGINVVGPAYLRVTVDADIVPRELAEADAVKQRISAALTDFFHPVTGGPDRAGWTLGRPVFISEVAQLLAGVPGVSHIRSLALAASLAQTRLTLAGPPAPAPLPAGSPVRTADGLVAGLLAGAIPAGTALGRLDVTGFREADQVTYALDLIVLAAPGAAGVARVRVAAGTPAVGFPRGSVVATADRTHLTRLRRGIRPAPHPDGPAPPGGDPITAADVTRASAQPSAPGSDAVPARRRPSVINGDADPGRPLIIADGGPLGPGPADSDDDRQLGPGPADSEDDGQPDPGPADSDDERPDPGPADSEDDQGFELALAQAVPVAAGDRITVYHPFAATVTGVRTEPGGELILTVLTPGPADAPPAGAIVSTVDGRVRAPVAADQPAGTPGSVRLGGFIAGQAVVLGPGRPGDPVLAATAERADPVTDHVHLEPYVFAYSTGHQIRITP